MLWIMKNKCSMTFSLESENVIKAYLFHDLDVVYVMKAFITLI